MAASDKASDDSLYPIAVLIDELKNEDIQVGFIVIIISFAMNKKSVFYFAIFCFYHFIVSHPFAIVIFYFLS